MIRLRRLLAIYHVIGRYRLDLLLSQRPVWLRLLLLPYCLCSPSLERGERLRQALQSLGPIFVKFGQLLSTRPDMVPSDICAQLRELQDNVEPFSNDQFAALVEQQLGAPIEELFADFERTPLASASVAQVHAATLSDGKKVVVKAIRPGIDKVINSDLRLLATLASLLQRFLADGKRLRPVEVVEDYRVTILDELDLRREAANTNLLRHNFNDSPQLYVPEIIWSHSAERVMVMERIYGVPVTDVPTLSAEGVDFKKLAETGVEIFFRQVFDDNFFHADMHPGNIFVDVRTPLEPSYYAIDCAIMGSLTREDRYYLARNLIAIFGRDYEQVAALHIESGWVSENTTLAELSSAVRTVCEPIFQRPIGEISVGLMLIHLFQIARRFEMEVQPGLVLLQKTLLNVEGLGRQLYPQLDLWQTAYPFLQSWLKKRYGAKGAWRQVKEQLPDILEHLPEVPQLIFAGLKQQAAQQHVKTPAADSAQPRRVQRWLGAAALGCGIALLSSTPLNTLLAQPISHWPGAATVLIAAGVAALLMA